MKTTKKLMFVGKTFAGKTTLIQYLKDTPLIYRKTQAIEIIDSQLIDTPGEFLEQRGFTGALMVTSVEADVIILLQASDEPHSMFPPAFSSIFTKPVIGVVSKSDIATKEQIAQISNCLLEAGASKVFSISSVTGEGLPELIDYIENLNTARE